MSYLYIKAFHIIFFTCWFAGLFYLPRFYVNLAMIDNDTTYQHLLVMARKLYRFITPFMLITIALGVWMLILNPGLMKAGWIHAKLTLVVILIGYHFLCGHHLTKFTRLETTKGHVFYRWFNEFPVLILFVVVILATVKPF
ncbi:CopD family protein [Aliikangiella maris]|uniref:Protoporphyrinogen IX oxidase n=2 Tax=Aliikangiella maris TaxID=3162458 RepID=A0ABV2BYJ2_9GAMM